LSAEVASTEQMKAPQCFAGQYVKQGELLLQIDTDDYDLEVKRLSELAKQAAISVEELELEYQYTLKLIALANEELQGQRKELERIYCPIGAMSRPNRISIRRGATNCFTEQYFSFFAKSCY
jgi:hypothetical protein